MTLLIRLASILNSAVKNFRRLVQEARRDGLGIIVDIVPSHGDWWRQSMVVDVLRAGATGALRNTLTSTGPRQSRPVAAKLVCRYSADLRPALATGEITVRCGKNGAAPSALSTRASHFHRKPRPCCGQPPYGDFDPASAEKIA